VPLPYLRPYRPRHRRRRLRILAPCNWPRRTLTLPGAQYVASPRNKVSQTDDCADSLANHGILPRDGRNLTIPMLVKAIGGGLNVSAEVATSLSTIGLTLSKSPSSGAFDLDDLNKHNAIEHDASLSRKDYDLGGNAQAFDEGVFNETLSYFNGASEIGIKEVAAARWGRVQSSKNDNPKLLYGDKQLFPSHFESSAYYQLFKNPNTDKASVKWIKIFFRKYLNGVHTFTS
jgi:hypothetical protein